MPDINESKIKWSILSVFAIILLFIALIMNTSFYKKQEYYNYKKLNFYSTLREKIDEHPIKHNPIYLSNGRELRVKRNIFDKLKIGDSIIKKANSDSVFYYTSKGLIIVDENKFRRETYLKSIND